MNAVLKFIFTPMPSTHTVDEEAMVRARLSLILRWGLAALGATAAVITLWTKQEARVSALEMSEADISREFKVVQHAVDIQREDMINLKADLRAQTNILKYLARDRRGPVPEELTK